MSADSSKTQTAKAKKSYGVLCTPEQLTRNNYFSDTYTAVMTVNGQKKAMDVTHISLPFRTQREKAVMRYFDISKTGMQELYVDLAAAITNQVRISKKLYKKGVGSTMHIVASEVVDRGSSKKDIYLVTEHLRPLTDVYFNGKTTLTTIFSFACRAAVLIRDTHEKMDGDPIHIRVFDPEQIFVDDSGMFVFGTFQYAYQEGSTNEPLIPAETAPLHIDGKVQAGAPGSIGSDMHTLASVLWSLLNGDGFDKPTPTGTPPKYATPAMVKALEIGLDGDPEMFNAFRKELQMIFRDLKKCEDGEIEVPVPLPPRCIDTELAKLDLDIVEKEIAPDTGNVEFVDEPESVKAVDASKYLSQHEASRNIEANAEDDLDLEITYSKPKFIIRQWLTALFLISVVVVILYISIKTRWISLW